MSLEQAENLLEEPIDDSGGSRKIETESPMYRWANTNLPGTLYAEVPEPEIGPVDLEEQHLSFPVLNLLEPQDLEQREPAEGYRPSHIHPDDWPPSDHSSQKDDAGGTPRVQVEGSWMSHPEGLTLEQLRTEWTTNCQLLIA